MCCCKNRLKLNFRVNVYFTDPYYFCDFFFGGGVTIIYFFLWPKKNFSTSKPKNIYFLCQIKWLNISFVTSFTISNRLKKYYFWPQLPRRSRFDLSKTIPIPNWPLLIQKYKYLIESLFGFNQLVLYNFEVLWDSWGTFWREMIIHTSILRYYISHY